MIRVVWSENLMQMGLDENMELVRVDNMKLDGLS